MTSFEGKPFELQNVNQKSCRSMLEKIRALMMLGQQQVGALMYSVLSGCLTGLCRTTRVFRFDLEDLAL